MKNIYTETKSTEVLWEVINYVVTSSIKLVVGLLFLFIGFKIVDTISKTIKKSLIKREVDKTIVINYKNNNIVNATLDGVEQTIVKN